MATSSVTFGTVVGLPHFWQSNVIPAAAASTTKEVEQWEQAKRMSLLGACMEMVEPPAGCIDRQFKQDTYRNLG
jgi:hypothetical protein